jgi:esterase
MTILAHSLIEADGVPTARRMLFLHGILGSGANLRTLAKQVCAAKPGWGALLVDMRMHGRSQDFAAPHTVQSAANDVLVLLREHALNIHGIVAHSFGGKVALELASALEGNLDEVTLLDSAPGPRPARSGSESTLQVLAVLGAAPPDFASRDAFIHYAKGAGLSDMLAAWLAMNIVAVDGGRVRFRLDLTAIHELLENYFHIDLWPVLENLPGRVRANLVLGETSSVFDDTARTRAANHWVHVDAPEATLAAILRSW